MAFRVPVANGSLTDITFNVKNSVSVNEINATFKLASETKYKGILEYTEDPIVSIDIVGNPHSCVLDSLMTSVIGNMVKDRKSTRLNSSHVVISYAFFCLKKKKTNKQK